jgi:hypothetical protein
MAKYVIDGATLEGLGDSIRSVTGSTKKFTPDEMIEEVKNILDATTFILVDQDGNEYPAVYVDSDTVCTATANDIRKGSVAITPEGVIEGTKEIPAYHTTEGYTLVTSGKKFSIPVRNGRYDYTKLQALLCSYNTSPSSSVSTDRVVIGDNVYAVNSIESISNVTINNEKQSIDLNIINDSNIIYIIRYFMYKEEY